MSGQMPPQQNIQTKISVLIFVKGAVAPIVLYFDNPVAVYENIKTIIQANEAPKVVELEANGPVKKVSLITSEITGTALQEEQYLIKP